MKAAKLEGVDKQEGGERRRGVPGYPWLRGRRLTSKLRADTRLAQFARFVLVGGTSNVVYVPLFLFLRPEGVVLANVVGAAASTVMSSELHRQLTFKAASRVTWFSAQWEAGGVAIVGVILSSLALTGAALWLPMLDGLWQLGVVFAVTGTIGVLRFLALRGLVFRRRGRVQNA